MKKLFGFAMVALCTVCLTGCGSNGNQLKCTGTLDGTETTLTANLDGDKVTKFSMSESQNFDDSTELDSAYQSSQLIIGMYNSIDGASGKVSKNGKKLSMSISMDLNKVNAEVAKSMLDGMFGSEELTKSVLEDYAEEQGLTCK